MGLRQTFSNPFYFLLVLAGLVFSITACAYMVMTLRNLRHAPSTDDPGGALMRWIDDHGFKMMLIELAVLGVFCILAMATDGYWEKRLAEKENRTGA